MTEPAPENPAVLDEDDPFGVETATVVLADRLARLRLSGVHRLDDGRPLLSPPFAPTRDHVEGPISADTTLLVFGAFATPGTPSLAAVLDDVRGRHLTTVRVVWRHFPDPGANPRAVDFALAGEAAAAHGKFWVLARELLKLRHDGPEDLHGAVVRAGLDPGRTLELMRAGLGAERIVDDAASALASGVMFTPALFIDGVGYRGKLEPAAVEAAIARA